MADAHIWVSASLPHTFRPNEVVQIFWWKEERQPGMWGAGVSPHLGSLPSGPSSEGPLVVVVSLAIAPCRSDPKRDGQQQ